MGSEMCIRDSNESIKDIDVSLTKEKQDVRTISFGPEPPQANADKMKNMHMKKLLQ